MKRVTKQVFSALLAIIIIATAIPFTAFAADENVQGNQTVSTDMGDMSLTATNSFGEMLAESLTELTDEQDNGCYISDVEYQGDCALVTFATKQNCTICVAAYEEDTGGMITSAMSDVLAADTEVIVEFEDELPKHFVLKAFMLDDNSAALCKAYTCNEETQMYQDFVETTVEDYPEDKVINLDESVDNNFLVMSDDTTTVTADGAKNALVSYNSETGVYTFSNIDEQVKSLNIGDIFYFDNGDVEELTFIKVGSINISGTTAYITEAEASIEEVFDTVKIDNEMTSGEFDIDDNEELEEGITYDGITEIEESEEFSTFAWESEKSITFQHDYTLEKTIKPKEPKKIGKLASLTGSIKIEGSAGFSVTGTFKYYISRKFSEVEFTLTPKVSVNVSVEGVGRFEVKLKSLDYSPCPGVYVGISPKFVVEASVEASFNTTLKFTLGFGYNTDDGLVNKTTKPTFKPEFKIEGKIFIGVDLAPRAYVITEKAAKIELGSEIGAQLTATLSTDNGENHLCNSCLDGDIDLVGDLTGKLVLGETTKWEKKIAITFLSIKIDIVSFYYSYTYGDFGWGKCPYSDYDNDGSDMPNESGVRDSGNCGNNLTWTLYNDGELKITGTGAMYNYSYEYSNGTFITTAPWGSYYSSIKTVTIGDSVTSIGNYAFRGCTSLTSVTIPDSVTSIGNYAFEYCKSLTSVTIPDSVTSIGDWPFMNCASLASITVDKDNTAYSSDEYGVLFNKDKTQLIQYPIGNERTSYTIPDSVTSIGGWAFYYCKSLTSVTIGDSVTSIGKYAFGYCTSLTSVTIGDSVTSIGNYAFEYCTSLTSVTIPDSVTSIGGGAFRYCKNLTSVTIGDSVTSIGKSAFYDCTSLTDVYYGGTQGQWNNISIGSNNQYLTGANIHYNSSTAVLASTYGTDAMLLVEDSDENNAQSYAEQSETVSIQAEAGADLTKYTAAKQSCIENEEYVLLVLKSGTEILELSDDDLLYIDQKTAESGKVSFTYIPKIDVEADVYIIGPSYSGETVQEKVTPRGVNDPYFEIVGGALVVTQGGVNYITGLQPSLTKAKFQSTYADYENVTLEYSMTTARYMGTGSTVTVKSNDGEVITEYVIVIYGDVDGTATINGRDAAAVSNSITGVADSLTGAAKLAANVEGTRATINAKDASVIRAVAGGSMTIDQSTGKGVEV